MCYFAPSEAGLKMVLVLRFLTKRDSLSSLAFDFRMGRSSVNKNTDSVWHTTTQEYQEAWRTCPTTPNARHKIGGVFHTRWSVSSALSALDGENVVITCP